MAEKGGVHGRGCAWQGGMHGGGHVGQGGHVWWGACMVGVCVWQGGMCGRGASMAGGCVWQGGHVWQRGHAWQGACMAGGMHGDGGVCVAGRCTCHAHTPQQILQDTVNEWAVRILLECILVIIQMTKVVQFLCTLYVLFYENLSSCVFAVESNVISKH